MEHYDSAVLEADTYVGLFLENLVTQGLWDNTVVIVTADHGEDLQEHGYFNHRTVIFDSTTRVPFLVTGGAVPQAWRGERRTDLVEALDIVPTVMDIAGSVPPAGARGRSVWSLLEGRPVASKDKVFQQGVLGQSSVRTATHRLVFQGYRLTDEGYGAHLAADPIDGGSFALFASSEEPREQQDILAANLGLAEELRKAMVEWYSTLDSGVAAKPISPEIQKTLHENGYW